MIRMIREIELPQDIINIIIKDTYNLKYNEIIEEINTNSGLHICLKSCHYHKKMCDTCKNYFCKKCKQLQDNCDSCIQNSYVKDAIINTFGLDIFDINWEYIKHIIFNTLKKQHKKSLHIDILNSAYRSFEELKEDIFVSYLTEI